MSNANRAMSNANHAMSNICYVMSDDLPEVQKKQLYIGKSQIIGAGDGLFAGEFIPSGIIIAEYAGDIVCDSDISRDDSDYSFHLGNDVSIIGKCPAAKINDNVDIGLSNIRELVRYGNYPHNCIFIKHGNGEFARVFVQTIKHIHKNCELFIDYGAEYWLCRINRNNKSD